MSVAIWGVLLGILFALIAIDGKLTRIATALENKQ